MTTRAADVAKAAVDAILWAYTRAADSEERELIAAQIARLDGGGARLELYELGQRALRETRKQS